MKNPTVTKYLSQPSNTDLKQFYYDLLLETDMVKYLVLKSLKLAKEQMFSALVQTVASIDPEKRIFKDVVTFYEKNKLEYMHPLDKSYPSLNLYVELFNNQYKIIE